MRIFHFMAWVVLSSLTLLACVEKPNFPNEPVVTLKVESIASESGLDKFLLRINFQDGNGDLGIASNERNPPDPLTPQNANKPFQEFVYTFNASGQVISKEKNPFFFNLYINIYKKDRITGAEELIVFPDFSYNNTFPILYEENRRTPMEGTIEYEIVPFSPPFNVGDLLRIEVRINDRDRNWSNFASDTVTVRSR